MGYRNFSGFQYYRRSGEYKQTFWLTWHFRWKNTFLSMGKFLKNAWVFLRKYYVTKIRKYFEKILKFMNKLKMFFRPCLLRTWRLTTFLSFEMSKTAVMNMKKIRWLWFHFHIYDVALLIMLKKILVYHWLKNYFAWSKFWLVYF